MKFKVGDRVSLRGTVTEIEECSAKTWYHVRFDKDRCVAPNSIHHTAMAKARRLVKKKRNRDEDFHRCRRALWSLEKERNELAQAVLDFDDCPVSKRNIDALKKYHADIIAKLKKERE
jgi:hypothetical protein